jgi:tRNA (guanine37-N1)-methyltransferase
MRFVLVTLFPEFFSGPLKLGLLGRAVETGVVQVETINPRTFTTDRHQSVDDGPFGGGPGMVMMVEPLVHALEEARRRFPVGKAVLLSPRGRRFTNQVARELAATDCVCLVCGRYEGVDERLVEGRFVEDEISIGDFVLNGGETAALAVIEACSRMLPGVVGNEESVRNDSFYDGLLDCPHYTRPRDFRGLVVPEVLLSGNHAEIARWRLRRALEETLRRRPDLLDVESLPEDMKKLLEP